ncbi:cytochrome c oxidase assembly protein COX11, mitochondrial-like [Homarus americanus]|uniref:cytochrome c oxidase assembly protein COX11, mitochondrial-like n=1 Tax=Homarus americanus TaxID=6706 RepID=UPI001C46EEC0|nr:cytochrome c oxidase assembly protein COX11, mitochondrial-like [Homarus americanus]
MYRSLRTVTVVCCDTGARTPREYWRLLQTPLLCVSNRRYAYSTFFPKQNVSTFNLVNKFLSGKPVNIVPLMRHLSIGVQRQQKSEEKEPSGGTKASFISRGTRSTLYYIAAVWVLAFGLSYAAVPLYRIFCQAYSYGGTPQEGHDAEKVESMQTVESRKIRVRFNADTAASMTWNFKPQQSEIKVHPGETALAFYTAKNPTNRPVIGVSTYNVVPFDAGQYFNKIQCFCFEEQLLNPHEEVHMPVFFYIDPEFADDPKMQNVDILTLSYTFFEAREGLQLPMPKFA